ncbi:MAG TPA: hypothetical protein DHW61_11395 [Lachnoclostridium phytofermentans]|uniref:Uncharacterized protein n=1 Tax=Lachnoclostridium phytofermentans TaxID=66219 RepID=A0A3D2X7W8_9FIRM|nr:hypothetical protein [Lachnoclostridium phytofermentans]
MVILCYIVVIYSKENRWVKVALTKNTEVSVNNQDLPQNLCSPKLAELRQQDGGLYEKTNH